MEIALLVSDHVVRLCHAVTTSAPQCATGGLATHALSPSKYLANVETLKSQFPVEQPDVLTLPAATNLASMYF